MIALNLQEACNYICIKEQGQSLITLLQLSGQLFTQNLITKVGNRGKLSIFALKRSKCIAYCCSFVYKYREKVMAQGQTNSFSVVERKRRIIFVSQNAFRKIVRLVEVDVVKPRYHPKLPPTRG